MKKISPARISAFEILKKIAAEKAFSSVLLAEYEEKLSEKDRALCHELTLGILRKQFYLDRIIEKLTNKKPGKFDLEVVLALRLGIYQMLFLDKIPAYSAINESVNLVYRAKKSSASGLVNAVLRRVSREKQLVTLDFADEIDKICVETSHPRWLIENWIGQFGIRETEQIAIANNQTPKSVFRFTAKFYRRNSEAQRNIINELKGFDLKNSELIQNCFIVNQSNERIRQLGVDGDIYFQEEGSQLVGQAVKLKESESFLDVCAAPGSKAGFVARNLETRRRGEEETRRQGDKETGRRGEEEIRRRGDKEKRRPRKMNCELQEIRNPKSEIRNRINPKSKIQNLMVLGDLYEHRLRVLRENCQNQGAGDVNILRYDALRVLPFADECFDVVLVDAPCSGTGTIRNNPEIRYFLEEKDFRELSGKQLKILRNASKTVKRGGRLIYSTCSLEKAENEAVIQEFLMENTEFKRVLPELPERFLTGDGFARTFPDRDQMDGFFIAVFEKK